MPHKRLYNHGLCNDVQTARNLKFMKILKIFIRQLKSERDYQQLTNNCTNGILAELILKIAEYDSCHICFICVIRIIFVILH